MAEPQTPQIDFTQPPPLIDFTQPPPGLGMAGGSLSNPASVPNARIRNLPNPAANETSPLGALYHGAKTGATLGMLPAAAAAVPTTIPAAIGTATGIAGGAAAGAGAKAGAEALGAGELGQEAAGDAGNIVGGILGAGFGEAGAKIGQRIYDALPKELQKEVLGMVGGRPLHAARLIRAAAKMLPEAAEATTPQAPAPTTPAPKFKATLYSNRGPQGFEGQSSLKSAMYGEGFYFGRAPEDVEGLSTRPNEPRQVLAADVNLSKPLMWDESLPKNEITKLADASIDSARKITRVSPEQAEAIRSSTSTYELRRALAKVDGQLAGHFVNEGARTLGYDGLVTDGQVAVFDRSSFTPKPGTAGSMAQSVAAPSGQITPQGQYYLGQLQQIARQIEAQEGKSTPKNVTPSRAAGLKKPLTPAASSDDLTNLLQESVKRAKAAKGKTLGGSLADLQ